MLKREFDPTIRAAIQREKSEKARLYIQELFPKLNEVSRELQERNFVVDEKCRIRNEAFSDIFGEDVISDDIETIKKLEREFQKKENRFQTEENKYIGELLEITKTIAFNKKWFNKRFIALRTSKYDDYVNGVDEIIFDTKTSEPLATIDTTTDINTKIHKVSSKIKNGSQVKYGFYIKEGVKRGSLVNLPTFIISLTSEEVLLLAGGIVHSPVTKETEEFERKIKHKILRSLFDQSLGFQKIAEPGLLSSYKRICSIFQEIISEEEKEREQKKT